MQIGFIGLGQMGAPMAKRLIAAGHAVKVYDTSNPSILSLVDSGATPSATPKDAASGSEIVILMLPNSKVVESVIFSNSGILTGMSSECLLIDMSSSHPIETKKIGLRLLESGHSIIDAPVSGGVARAENGTLALMVGGTDTDVAKALPILKVMGSTVTHTGPLASGHALKALNNLLSASGLIAAAEVLLVGQRFGLDPNVMLSALNQSSGMNNSTKNKLPQFVLTRLFNSGFSLDLMVKDLTIAMDLAKETQTAAPSSALIRELAAAAQSMLGEGHDHTEAIKILETMCQEEIGDKPNA